MNNAIPGSISQGTLRTCDLLNAFVGELGRLNPSALEAVYEGSPQLREWVENPLDACPYLDGIEGVHAQQDLLALMEALEDEAPEGYYFGSHEGDGADFGFWPIQEW